MTKEELEDKIKRFEKLSTQRKFSKEEFREMDGYLKQIRPNWVGCAYCPAQINFGQTILSSELNSLRSQLGSMSVELPSTISTDLSETAEVAIEAPLEELPPIPVGDVVVTSECKKCRKKNKRNT
jgi:hypothetical protein